MGQLRDDQGDDDGDKEADEAIYDHVTSPQVAHDGELEAVTVKAYHRRLVLVVHLSSGREQGGWRSEKGDTGRSPAAPAKQQIQNRESNVNMAKGGCI